MKTRNTTQQAAEKIAKEAITCAMKIKEFAQNLIQKEALNEYCREIETKFKPVCIILYGSRAKETFTNFSDIDIIVIHDFRTMPIFSIF